MPSSVLDPMEVCYFQVLECSFIEPLKNLIKRGMGPNQARGVLESKALETLDFYNENGITSTEVKAAIEMALELAVYSIKKESSPRSSTS